MCVFKRSRLGVYGQAPSLETTLRSHHSCSRDCCKMWSNAALGCCGQRLVWRRACRSCAMLPGSITTLMLTTTPGCQAPRATTVHQDSIKIRLCDAAIHFFCCASFRTLSSDVGPQVNRFASMLVYLNDEAGTGASKPPNKTPNKTLSGTTID